MAHLPVRTSLDEVVFDAFDVLIVGAGLAGTVFAEVDPKLAVYTHLVMLSSLTIPEAPLASLITRTRTNYQGPLVIGEDLMSFIVDDRVSIYRAAR